MAKKVLILSGSPRKGGNSDTLCDQFMKGAQEAGNEVEKIWVQGRKVAPCLACYYCKDNKGECTIKDDMKEILEKMLAADVLVLSSPVYFYSISAQLKAVIDRTVARWLDFISCFLRTFHELVTECVGITSLARRTRQNQYFL